MKKLLIIFFLITVSLNSYAQLEAKNWYFGVCQGMKFESNSPTPIYDSKMYGGRGTSTISDKNGNLLFYSNGNTIWNKNHDTLKNGYGLNNSSACDQSPMIIPHPGGNPNIYYLFTVQYPYLGQNLTTEGFWYHILDMTKDNGNGEIVLKNKKICSNVNDKIAAILHANRKSVWILVKDFNSNKLKAYLLKNTGLDTTPVISSVGTYTGSVWGDGGGQMKFSPSSKKLANAIYRTGEVDIFDFDNKTGKVSNCITIDSIPQVEGHDRTYGIEFSHNEKFLYFSVDGAPGQLYQVDISSGIDSIIKQSLFAVYINNYSNDYYCLQIGLDKKIYLARPNYYLGCINKPDLKGNACNYVDSAIKFNNGVGMSLPTFLQSYFYLPDIEIENTCLGDSTAFSLKDTSNIDSVYWYFGDSNYSWQFYPKHVYSDTGIYITNAVIFYDNTNDTFEREIRISNYAYANFGIADNSQCLLGNEFYFYDSSTAIDGSMTYEWDFGDSTGSFQQNPVKSFLVADTFNVKLTVTSSYGCETSKTKELYVQPMPETKININDTAQCFNENSFTFLNPSDSLNLNVSKTWYFGDGNTSNADTAQHIYLIADTFNVVLIEETNQGCRDTATREIIVFPSPVTDFSVND
ncbi:MAG: PKD domain-containing protein, partial [Bacteroidota bacterium]|nr:PKD domain-containing protein [Bacteroidota bacterium]